MIDDDSKLSMDKSATKVMTNKRNLTDNRAHLVITLRLNGEVV